MDYQASHREYVDHGFDVLSSILFMEG